MKDFKVVGWVALSVAIFASTIEAARSWERVKTRTRPTISVTGSAKRRIVSDLITWDATITTQGGDTTSAYRTLHDDVAKAQAYLHQQGLGDPEIRVGSVTTQEIIEQETVGAGDQRVQKEVSKGFTTTQVISVTSAQVAKVERISREVTSLIEAGVPISSAPPAYFYTKLGELKIEMLAEASKDARTRAEKILRSAGEASLGKLTDADMGVINVNPANTTSTSWDGNNDTGSLEKDIITIVHCTFEIGTGS